VPQGAARRRCGLSFCESGHPDDLGVGRLTASSSNNPASLTSRLGATIDVEQNHVRFLGDLILNLWDCGGQDAFMDSYLTTQRSTIFQNVVMMIYVFDVESREMHKDLEYYRDCLNGLNQFSPGAAVFLLIHKMDLVRGTKSIVFGKKKSELQLASGDVDLTVFGTSIFDEQGHTSSPVLYVYAGHHRCVAQAWSSIVHTLIPNRAVLSKHLTTFVEACSATEVILFERTTFLVIAHTSDTSSSPGHSDTSESPLATHQLNPTWYERTTAGGCSA
jgi:Ras-related GTP-binding protein A/B